jgi:uncharacterized membrane protein
MTRLHKITLGMLFALCLVSPTLVQAQEIIQDKVDIIRAKVLEIVKEEVKNVPGTDVRASNQTIKIEILEGDERGKQITVDNDYLNLNVGEVFYLRHQYGGMDGTNYYSVDEPYRLPHVLILVALFIIAIFVFGGIQGVRGLVSLVGSFLLIIYVLLPGILHGYSPLLVTIGVSSLIIIVGSYITHGFNKTTSSAVLGMVITVIITGLLAVWAVHFTRLSGFGSEEVVYLNLNTRGTLDVVGLLLGGIMIGLLGVLYDVAIGQAISVEELIRIAPHVTKKTIYQRAIRIGREHIGALVNTLAIAYVGASLPLLLLFIQTSTSSLANIANREIFATEIVRTMIGSIGLILAVPITTFVAVWLLMRMKKNNVSQEKLQKEQEALEHAGHPVLLKTTENYMRDRSGADFL